VFACYDRGRAVALFSHRRLRERPPWGGVSVLSESAPLCPQASASATALLDAIGWHGVAMVEFKRDDRDDTPRLMEINGRFWGSLQLAIDAGVDFPAMLLTLVEGGSFPPQAPYRLGVRNRWLWGDVDNLILTLTGSGPAGPRRGRLRAVGDFLAFRGKDLHYENPRRGDLRPFAFESYRWCARLVGRQGSGGEG
jgi:predicted ATP-grasp superfamily ATP-dependent carboligase